MTVMEKTDAVETALDRLYEKINRTNSKQGEISDSCAEFYARLLEGVEKGEKALMLIGSEEEYSRAGGSYYYDGGSYARKRDRMGRYSREGGSYGGGSYGGYSRHDAGSLKMKLKQLMEESPDEYRDLMDQLERG